MEYFSMIKFNKIISYNFILAGLLTVIMFTTGMESENSSTGNNTEFDTLAAALAHPDLRRGQIITLRAYHQRVPARHQRIVAKSDDGSGVPYKKMWLNIYSDGKVNVKWFGARGDDKKDDIDYLQKASSYPKANVIVLGTNEIYKTTKPFILEPRKTYIANNTTLHAVFTKGNIVETRETQGRPPFNLIGNRFFLRGNDYTKNTLNGLKIGSCAFANFSGIVVQHCGGNSLLLAATGKRDIISITIDRVETWTGNGMKLMTGQIDGVRYGNITDGTISNSFFTCRSPKAIGVEMIVRPFSKTSKRQGSSIFGLDFNRCSFNVVNKSGGSFVIIDAAKKCDIYNIEFKNCEGEFRVPKGTPRLYPAVYLKGVVRSRFDIQGQVEKSTGFKLVNSDNNSFNFLLDKNIYPDVKSKFIEIDKDSHGNIFNNISTYTSQISTDDGYNNAPASSFFLNRIVDNGFFNTFRGTISSQVNRYLKLDYLSLINSKKKFIDPLMAPKVAWKYNAKYKVSEKELEITLSKGAKHPGFGFLVNDKIKKNEVFCVNMEYRFKSKYPEIKNKFYIQTGIGGVFKKVQMTKTDKWNKQAFFTRKTSNLCAIRYMGTIPEDVVIEFRKIEIVTGGIPAVKNVKYTDIKNHFYEFPKVSSKNIPVNSGARNDLVIYNKSSNSLMYFNGKIWKNK
jgi:hypothetical protein